MAIYYVDLENGNDANNGTSFALRKKTIASIASGRGNGDEVRVMASPDPVLIGSGTWTAKNRNNPKSITNITGTSELTITISSTELWEVGDLVLITGNTTHDLNGSNFLNDIWKISTVVSTTTYKLTGSDFTGGTVNSGNYGIIQNVSSTLVEVVGEKAKIIKPQSWTAVTIPNAPSAWVETTTQINGIFNTTVQTIGTYDTSTGKSYFTPYEYSAWRITHTSSTTATVQQIAYTGYQDTWTSYVNNINNSIGVDSGNYSTYHPYSVPFQGLNSNYIYHNADGYIQFGSTSTTTTYAANNPSIRKIFISTRNGATRILRYKTIGSTGSRKTLVLYEGISTSPPSSSIPTDLIYEFVTYEGQNYQDLYIHKNTNYSFETLAPSVTNSDGKHSDGFLITLSSGPTNTELVSTSLSSPLDLSAFSVFSFNMYDLTSIPSGLYFRIKTSSGSDIDIPLPTGGGSSWQPVTIEGVTLPNDVTGFAIYNSSADLSGVTKIKISDIAASLYSFTGNTLIGRNIPGETWYPIGSLRVKYGNTFIGLRQRSSEDETIADGVAYLSCTGTQIYTNSSETFSGVDTYIKSTIPYSDGQQNILSGGYFTISGGWDRTDMSTVVGETWIKPTTSLDYFLYLSNRFKIDIKNFGIMDCTQAGINYTASGGSTIENCHLSFCTMGISHNNHESSLLKQIYTVGCTTGLSLNTSNRVRVQDSKIYSSYNGIARAAGGTSSHGSSLVNVAIRGFTNYGLEESGPGNGNHDYNVELVGVKPCFFGGANNYHSHSMLFGRTKTSSQYHLTLGNTGNASFYQPLFTDGSVLSISYQGYTGTESTALFSTRTGTGGSGDYNIFYPGGYSSFYGWQLYKAYTTSSWSGGGAYMWAIANKFSNSAHLTINRPAEITLAEIPVYAAEPITVSIRSKPVPTTFANQYIAARMRLEKYNDVGLVDDHYVDLATPENSAANRNIWGQHQFSFTPAKNGVARIILQAYWSSSTTQYIYFDDFQIT